MNGLQMHIVKKTALALSLGALPFSAVNADMASDKQAIQQQLKNIIPDAPDANITPSVLPGLYEVSVGPMVIYMTGDAKYVLNGSLIDLNTRENLTERTKANARKAALAKIPADSMITYPAKGESKHVVTVFSDIDCPYCHKLHKEIPALNEAGVTVRYLSYPRAGAGSPAYQKAVTAWCSENRNEAMNKLMAGEQMVSKNCDNPVLAHMQQAQVFGVNGTPNIILENGDMIPGYVPAKELVQMLQQKH
ncbi:MAG: DsbC family protein [Gammaproteobacteria bacterium]|nr:DsbC family protein [Gammaproteobacteria bacterium]MBD3775524.1 DsbC family protein [Thiotrichales bacterium]